MIGIVICIALIALMRYTKLGKKLSAMIKFGYLVTRHQKIPAWIKANKDGTVLRTLETARWFPWYGKRVIYMKSKKDEDLTVSKSASPTSVTFSVRWKSVASRRRRRVPSTSV